jgi:hypothetical protein
MSRSGWDRHAKLLVAGCWLLVAGCWLHYTTPWKNNKYAIVAERIFFFAKLLFQTPQAERII